jgi:hypothetical protein
MTRRLREIVPQWGFLLAIVVIYVLFEAPMIYFKWWMGVPFPPVTSHPSYAFLKFAALVYGASPVLAAHPFYRISYREWLELTPWTSRLPLPLGAPRLVWGDCLALGMVLLLPSVHPHVDPTRIISLTLLSATVCMAVPLWFTGLPGMGYAIALMVGLAVRMFPDRWAYFGVSVASYIMAAIGLRLCLARFPWPLEWLREMLQAQSGGLVRLEHFKGAPCGWPYDLLRPPPPRPFRLCIHDSALLSLLAGWWVFAWESLFEDPRDGVMMSLIVLMVATLASVAVRFGLYRSGHAPPLNLWARFFTGRWIIPGYDQIYVGPACALVAAVFAHRLLSLAGLPIEAVCPTCLALVLFVALTSPPGLTRWQMTGQHRLEPSIGHQQDKVKYVRVG